MIALTVILKLAERWMKTSGFQNDILRDILKLRLTISCDIPPRQDPNTSTGSHILIVAAINGINDISLIYNMDPS